MNKPLTLPATVACTAWLLVAGQPGPALVFAAFGFAVVVVQALDS